MKINDFVHSPTMQIFIHIIIFFSGEISLYGVRCTLCVCFWLCVVQCDWSEIHFLHFSSLLVSSCRNENIYPLIVLCIVFMYYVTANGEKKQKNYKAYTLCCVCVFETKIKRFKKDICWHWKHVWMLDKFYDTIRYLNRIVSHSFSSMADASCTTQPQYCCDAIDKCVPSWNINFFYEFS